MKSKLSNKLIKDFGDEWYRFDQSNLDKKELELLFNIYFSIFPKDTLNKKNVGIDIGGGSGRWTKCLINKVNHIFFVEPSAKAINVAKKNLNNFNNVTFLNQSVFDMKIKNNFADFAFSLGVLHHVEDTLQALKNINLKLKKNAPFLIYLYYNFENRSLAFKILWRVSDFLRLFVSNMPKHIKLFICDSIAVLMYFPLTKFYRFLRYFKISIDNFPLSYYTDLSFYTLRTDSLDRFGTKFEKRFSKKQIEILLNAAGFNNIKFSDKEPFWCVLSNKK